MSLQTRIVALIGLVLLVSVALGSVFAGVQARRALKEELHGGLIGGAQTAQGAFRDLPYSGQPARDLRQLISAFDGDRHVMAELVASDGRIAAVSTPQVVGDRAPGWFRRLAGSEPAPIRLPVPASVGGMRAVVLTPVADADLGAAWSELTGVVLVLVVTAGAGLVLVFGAIGAALAPLRELSASFARIGSGDYGGRVKERGPPELVRLEQSFNDMAERLAAISAQNRRLERQLLTLQDEERAELARDLHDEIGPHLFAVSLDARTIAELLASRRYDAVPAQVAAIQAAVGDVQREIRSLVARLRPTRVVELGLDRAVSDLVRFWQARRPEIVFEVTPLRDEAGLDDGLKDTAFRVVQEAVNNAVRHAEPDRVAIQIERTGSRLRVRVGNDGPAREPAEPAGSGFGLIGMRERVAAQDGELHVGPGERPGETWSVSASLPIEAAAATPMEATA